MPCYICFNVTCLCQSVFYAIGRTEILICISFVINVVIVAVFLMATYDVIAMNVRTVASIFGGGLVLGSIPNTVVYFVVARRKGGLI